MKEKKMNEVMKKFIERNELKNGNAKKKFRNVGVKKRLQNGNAKKKFKLRNVGEKKNTRNGSEKMKWNLSCKKYFLEQKKLKLKLEPAVNKLYGFGNQRMPALTSIGRIEADNVEGESISIYVVPDDAQSVDLIIGRTWLDLPHIAYAKIGKRLLIGCQEDEPFRNFPIEEKVNRVCLKRLETAQLEKENFQIKNSSQQKMIGNLANDLEMVKNEIKLLQGDIRNFKEERHSLLLQIQEKNVENLKSNNDSLLKMNTYYDKKKSDNYRFIKEKSWQ
ncbi:hypothetical protein AVEN_134210-1 [Araneus ventricosus]|uniref:Uncharacterized protein n=1 Tax=Araneus ventricosus TaxID=182803 RepID=A0A4Y2EQ83_ARAVE|nr:hypothetical protein AVEN_134210-1 [Araneus ventricosus]